MSLNGFYETIDHNIRLRELIKRLKIPKKPVIYRHKNALNHFISSTIEVSITICKLYKIRKTLYKLNNKVKIEFQNAAIYEIICLKELDDMSEYKVTDIY